MIRAVRLGALAALLAAAVPARAFVRTTDAHTGVTLSWPVPLVPWHLNRDWPDSSPSCQATASGDPTVDAVRASFAQWEQGCTDLKLLYAGELSELRTGAAGTTENLVVFRRGWCSQHPQASVDPCMSDPEVDCGSIYGCFDDGPGCIGKNPCAAWGIVALTSVLYDPSSGRVMDANIEVAAWDGTAGFIGNPPQHGWYFTCFPGTQPGATCATYAQPSCKFMDLQNTVTHEVGHFVGLAHSTVAGATMNATTSPGETAKRDLAPDDIQGVCAIYPQTSGGGCGCGGGDPVGAASLVLAALALRPRRRA